MNSKTGMVMEIKNKYAYILTPDGEFVKVKIKGNVPPIGSTYYGKPSSKLPLSKYAAMAACLILFFSFGGAAYAYYTPVASLVLKVDPSIELKINRWNKIIATQPLNDDGKNILDSVNLKNKSINEGLNILLDKASKENLVKSKPEDTKKISLDVNSDKDLNLNIHEFENKVKDKNLELEVKYTEPVNSNNTKDNITTPKKNADKQNNSNSKNNQNGNKDEDKNLKNSEKSKNKKNTKNSMKPVEKKSPSNEKNKKKITKPENKKSSKKKHLQ
ncbi:anti-sigma factor domain-containing protein [Clostridium sp. ZS2-4]|uniref:anti-sigma factor domain-containing protein n=1 Tax=Clostridium sp. ZS2-4 TaxID=2987703 RepID=UPI00227B6C9E|nr:anti-sigma factor domain-containing protein [Clostridium sp. ZS2-4]MCY6354904.1 anti-sigma factor domain-containing protein [Clostridium sp. ZS2-4]